MTISEKIEYLYSLKYWDAIGCGHNEDESEAIALRATAALRNTLKAVERVQAPQTPRFQNLAGRRQAAARGYFR